MQFENEESIYNLIPKEPIRQEKQIRYKSKFNGENGIQHNSLDRSTYKDKGGSKTMGPAKVELNPPERFLRSHEKEFTLPRSKTTFKYSDEDRRKPPVPKVDEKPVMGLRSDKNFIVENAIQNITAIPKLPERSFVDSRYGSKQLLDTSGYQPVYLNKKDFGKTPIYLEKRKQELSQNQADMEAYIEANERKNKMRRMTDDERNTIIKGLKENWNQIYKKYLTLPMVVDTPAKKMMKEKMERDMDELERDARLIEEHGVIYIAD